MNNSISVNIKPYIIDFIIMLIYLKNVDFYVNFCFIVWVLRW